MTQIGKRLPLLVILASALAILALAAHGFGGVGGTWQVTSLARSTPNDCHDYGLRCAEWCLISSGSSAGSPGAGVPTGELCCVSSNTIGEEQIDQGLSCLRGVRSN